jgi:hypothetical protein
MRKVQLVEFLKKAWGEKLLQSLIAQLVWGFSKHLDQALARQLQQPELTRRVRFSWVAMDDLFDSTNAIAHKLMEYVVEGAEASIGHHFVSMATDKGIVKGLPLHNSAFVYVNNLCVISPPQVFIALVGISHPQGSGLFCVIVSFCLHISSSAASPPSSSS